jgi:hypothetical protein
VRRHMDAESKVSNTESGPYRVAVTAIGTFWIFGATMAAFAGTTLIWQNTFLPRVWRLNPEAWRMLAPIGNLAGPLFLAFSALLLTTAILWFRRHLWGWRLGIAILLTQVVGDLFNLVRGDYLRAGPGVVIAGALLYFLLRPQMRRNFK